MGYEKAASLSLRDKLVNISVISYKHTRDIECETKFITDCHGTQSGDPITSQLWVHSQMALLKKPTTSIQACVASDMIDRISESDEILAEEERTWCLHLPSTPRDDTGLNDSSNIPLDGPLFRPSRSASSGYAQKTQQDGKPFDHANLDNDPWGAEDDLLLDSPTHSAPVPMVYPSDGKTTPSLSLNGGPKPRLSAVGYRATIQQAERSFGSIEPADFPLSPGTSSDMGSAGIIPDEPPLIEESGDHNIDCADDILLAF